MSDVNATRNLSLVNLEDEDENSECCRGLIREHLCKQTIEYHRTQKCIKDDKRRLFSVCCIGDKV